MPTPTLKQRLFVKEYIKNNGNGTQAVLKVYDTTDPNTAKAISSENLTKPDVQEELKRAINKEELQLNTLTQELASVIHSQPIKGYTGADKLEAIKTGLKLHGVLTERKVTTAYTINADLNKLSKYELIELHKKKTLETQHILDGEEG